LALIIASKFTTYNSSVSALPDYYITGPVPPFAVVLIPDPLIILTPYLAQWIRDQARRVILLQTTRRA